MKKVSLVILAFVLASPLAAVQDKSLHVGMANLEMALRAVPTGGSLVLEGVSLGLGSLELERFEAFTADAQIVIHGAEGDTILGPPDNRYFKGHVTGVLGSRVVLSVTSSGVRGLASSGGRYWLIGRGMAAKAPAAGLTVVEVDPAMAGPGFTCGTNQLSDERISPVAPAMVTRHSSFPEAVTTTYGARIGVETDNEFLALFGGDTSAATDYVGDLIAHNSTIYSDEIDTGMAVSHLSLWTSADPWAEFSTICGLFEFGRYWNDFNGAVDRTIAHFMSGKNNGGGVAWVGVLCRGGFSTNIDGAGCGTLSPLIHNYGGAYGYSGGMDGDFDINSPSVVWDIVVTSHEMGHNFNSPHTHCYENVGGNSSAVDNCYDGQCGTSGCFCGSPSLPSGCPGSGSGCGTIMSYCHLLSGGLSNISLTFGNPGGTPFIYGIDPERVPARMSSHVVTTAGGDPSCLAPVEDIFADGFESGDVTGWDSSTP